MEPQPGHPTQVVSGGIGGLLLGDRVVGTIAAARRFEKVRVW
jgi:hypothetical protein